MFVYLDEKTINEVAQETLRRKKEKREYYLKYYNSHSFKKTHQKVYGLLKEFGTLQNLEYTFDEDILIDDLTHKEFYKYCKTIKAVSNYKSYINFKGQFPSHVLEYDGILYEKVHGKHRVYRCSLKK